MRWFWIDKFTDFESGRTQQIAADCDNISYYSVSALADGSKLLVGRTDDELRHIAQHDNEPNIIYSESHIYLMDIDGSNMQRIVIK